MTDPASSHPRLVSGTSRRDFIRRATAATSLLALGSRAAAADPEAPTIAPRDPGDRVRLAVIGIGNRGEQVINAFADTGLVEFITAADVDLAGAHCAEARERLAGLPLYQDFRVMLAEQGDRFDAVAICTPDFSHFPITMACMAAGKHVYVEKPLAHTFQEIELLMAQAERTGVVTQMGNQGHSGANYFQFKAWTEAGIIKDVTRIDAHMNSPRRWHGWTVDRFDAAAPIPASLDWDQWHVGRPVHPFSERLHPGNWRSWFEYGNGAFGDWGPHILDTAHRFLELGLPERIETVHRDGPSPYIFPQGSTIRFSFPARGDKPPCVVTWFDGVANLPELPAEERAEVQRQPNGKYIYGGDLVFKGGTHSATLRILPDDKMRELAPTLPRFPAKNSDHFANFALACLGQEEARSPFAVSGPLSQVFLLGVIAQRLGGSLAFDRETKRFTEHPDANQYLQGPPPRPGWEQYYRI